MQSLLDYLVSVMAGGMLLTTLLGFYGHVEDTAAQQAISMTVQEEMTSYTEVIEYDFRKIGYGASADPLRISYADSAKIVFKSDIDMSGTIDSVTYFVGSVQTPGSSNPQSRILYRALNAQPARGLINGVIGFKIKYFDATGNPTATLGAIRAMDVAMTIESPVVVDAVKAGVYWERTISPTNLR